MAAAVPAELLSLYACIDFEERCVLVESQTPWDQEHDLAFMLPEGLLFHATMMDAADHFMTSVWANSRPEAPNPGGSVGLGDRLLNKGHMYFWWHGWPRSMYSPVPHTPQAYAAGCVRHGHDCHSDDSTNMCQTLMDLRHTPQG